MKGVQGKMFSSNSEAGFAIGFILGVTVGFGIAFVLAPQSGEETRALLKEKASDVGGKVREVTGDRKKIYAKTWKQSRGQARKMPYAEGLE